MSAAPVECSTCEHWDSCPRHTKADSGAPLFTHVQPGEVFGELADGGSINVDEWVCEGLPALAKRAGEHTGTILVEVNNEDGEWYDKNPGPRCDSVSTHADECDRLALFDRAIAALQNARAALVEAGYVDVQQRKAGR